ncbi:MAG: hypothetical protein HPY66_1632 [Firmicutes bacterium]|nr:hypothetical protein [Bacillota bacterium]
MNFILAFIQLMLIFLIVLIEYRNASTVIFLWATLLVMFGLPHFIAVLTQTLIYPESVYLKASLFVILFNLIYLMFRYVFKIIFGKFEVINCIKEEIKNNAIIYNQRKESLRLLITLILFFSVSIFLIIKDYGSIYNTSWGLIYTNSLSAYSLGFNIQSISFFTKYIVFATGGLFTYYFYKKDLVKSFLTAIIIILYTIITRNRILILPIVIPVLLIFLLKYRKLNFKKVILYGILGCGVIYIVYALRLFRHFGDLTTFINTFEFESFNKRLFEMLLSGDGELGLRNVFLYFIYNDNNFLNFNKGHTYLRLLFMFIPTKYALGLKPPDFAISMGSAWMGDFTNNRFSTHPTLYGDCFANLYWFGIFLAIFWALIAVVIDKIIYKSNLLKKLNYISIFGSMYIIVGRGSVYNGVLLGTISAILLQIMYIVYHKFPRIKLTSKSYNL